jgi:hypothetical protein
MLASGCSSNDVLLRDPNPPSVEELSEAGRVVFAFSLEGYVYWVEEGSVYHLCAYQDTNRNGTQDPDENELIRAFSRGASEIHKTSLQEAVGAGKYHLSVDGYSECGYDQNNPIFPACLEDAVNCQ